MAAHRLRRRRPRRIREMVVFRLEAPRTNCIKTSNPGHRGRCGAGLLANTTA
jgi:hypothetical protein